MNSNQNNISGNKRVELPSGSSGPSAGGVALGLVLNIVVGILLTIGLLYGVIVDAPIWILGSVAAVAVVVQRIIRNAIVG